MVETAFEACCIMPTGESGVLGGCPALNRLAHVVAHGKPSALWGLADNYETRLIPYADDAFGFALGQPPINR
jgi:hypothetical protein